MSRTYRRINAHCLKETAKMAELWGEKYLQKYHGSCEAFINRCHTDNSRGRYGPNKPWRRSSHKKARARQRTELKKVMLDTEHDYNTDLKDEAHGLSLWDWY